MIFIPRRFIPYFLVLLGILGFFIVAKNGSHPDSATVIIVSALCCIGGAIWAYIDFQRSKRYKKSADLSYALHADEHVVFSALMSMFGTETDRLLGSAGSRLTLTNKRLIADNGRGVWTADLGEIVSCTKVESGKSIFKNVCFLVILNTQIVYNDGKDSLSGFRFYLNKNDTAQFESIINTVIPNTLYMPM